VWLTRVGDPGRHMATWAGTPIPAGPESLLLPRLGRSSSRLGCSTPAGPAARSSASARVGRLSIPAGPVALSHRLGFGRLLRLGRWDFIPAGPPGPPARPALALSGWAGIACPSAGLLLAPVGLLLWPGFIPSGRHIHTVSAGPGRDPWPSPDYSQGRPRYALPGRITPL
jgi:hypothetical protein